MLKLLMAVDKAGGYAFGGAEGGGDMVWQVAMREGWGGEEEVGLQERWVDEREKWDEWETKKAEEEMERLRKMEEERGEMEI